MGGTEVEGAVLAREREREVLSGGSWCTVFMFFPPFLDFLSGAGGGVAGGYRDFYASTTAFFEI